MRRMLFLLLFLLVSLPISTHAAIFVSENFDVADIEDHGWIFKQGWCNFNQPARTDPCPEIDVTLTQAVSGTRSLKLHYDAAWSDPNPQTHAQAIAKLPGVMASATQKHLWASYWYKAPGFQYTAASSTKQLYWKNTQNTAPTFVSNFFFGGVRGTHNNNATGSAEMGMSIQGMDDTCPTSGSPSPSECNFYPNMASVRLNDNVWRCVTEHIQLNDPGVKNGNLEIFIDSQQTLGWYNYRFLSAAPKPSNATQSGCVYPTNGGCGYITPSTVIDLFEIYKQNGHGDKFFDDLVISDTRLGCSGTPPVTQTDTTPPTAPSGVSNTAQSASSLTFSLTVGVDSVSSNLILNTERCTVTTGTTCTSFSPMTQTGATGGSVISYVSSPLAASTRYCFRWNNQDAVGLLSPYTAVFCATTGAPSTTPTRRTLATIPFTLSNENPLSNGSTFDGSYTAYGNLKVDSNAVQSALLGTPGFMTYNGSTGLGDSWCQFVVTNFAGSVATEQGCALQVANSPTATFNLCKILLNSANKTEIDLYTAGVKSVLASEGATTWGNGDVGLCTKQGSAISFYRNDNLVLSGTDASLTSGRIGLYAYTSSGGGGGSITYDNAASGQNNSNTISANITVGAVSNPALFACVYLRDASSAQTVSSITRNGSGFTLVKQETALFSGTADTRVALYVQTNPTVGTYPVNVTLSGTPYWYTGLAVVSLGGVDQSTPAEASNSTDSDAAGTGGSTISHSLTTLTNNAVVVDCALGQADGALTPNGSQTGRASMTLGTAVDGAGMSTKATTTAGSTPISWTQVASGSHWIHVSGSAKPAGGTAGDLTQNVIDTLVLGDWVSTAQPVVLDAVCNLTPAPGCTLTYDSPTPTFVRVITGSNLGNPPMTDIVYPIADIPAGRYTPPGGGWQTGINYICFIGQDANHVESTNPDDKECRTITNLTQTDVTAPVLSVGSPNGQTITTTTAVLSITSDEFSTVRFDLADVAYDEMQMGQLDTVDGIHHAATVSGLSNGSHTYYFCGRDVAEPLPNTCSVRVSMTFTVNTGGADTTPPTAPSGLVCSAVQNSPSQATCTYNASTDAVGVTGYRATIGISNGLSCNPTTIINPGWSTATTQALIGLQPSKTYCLVVQGLDLAGLASAASNVATWTQPDQVNPIPPDKVLNVHVIPGTLKWNELGVQWDASSVSGVATSYQVFRCQVGYTCPNYVVRYIVPGLSFTDGNVLPSTTYRYIVYGSGPAGTSVTPSDVLEVTTPKIPEGSKLGVCPCEGVNQ